ncbi:cell wall-binding repeat-containing protein [Herbiconiux sp. CPCC 203406]|uniref:cell wall-binding repeat-containing protein n=1 Tax=Herbiconiux oxytropis TaxID=2970915 RepID=UPI00217DB6A2|nr:cell wall-binding repeat-containing protein [Herbiconiux oxytropis]MCS5722001.1 cell wall-binding repeat-containing protein [Herbiconiux oxytropis]
MLDRQNDAVQVYDISGPSFTHLGTVDGGVDVPVAAVVNESTHMLYLADSDRDSIVVIDVDPASPSVNTVVRTILTGSSSVGGIAVDELRNRVFVANTAGNTVSVLDVTAGSGPQSVPVGREPQDVVVDPLTGKAYVSSAVDSSITVINTDGSWTAWPLENRPQLLAYAEGALYVSTDRPYAAHVDKYSLATSALLASSPPLAGLPNDIDVDPALHAVYLVDSASGVAGVTTLRTTDLSREDDGPEDYFNSVVIEPRTHRILVGETPRLARPSEVVMLDPLPRPLPSVDRIDGADRFEVSAGVAGDGFASGVPVAFVTTGATFADALAGSAAAGAGRGPVLLVSQNSVPPAVAARLKSLRPQRIVVLGGTASVSVAVEKKLGEFSSSVSRLSGADRYAVSAAVSAAAFPDGADIVYLASGVVFSDALSASAAAGLGGGPVLLTKKGSTSAEVLAELGRLKPATVIVVGGTNTVDEAVVATLQATWPVVRIDGADRYAVSGAITARTFPQSAYTIYVASGAVFPDALSGSAAAIAQDAPVLLVQKDGIPATVAAQLDRLNPYRIVVLGGTNTVSDAVQSQLESYLPH